MGKYNNFYIFFILMSLVLTGCEPEPDIRYTITVSAKPVSGGTVTGAGTYGEGTEVTVTATANEGYVFDSWTEDAAVVSKNAAYQFTVTDDHRLVANFEEIFVTDDLFTFILQEKVAEEGWENISMVESRDGRFLYVISSYDYKLYVVDSQTLAVISDLELEGWLSSITHHPVESSVFVTSTTGGTRDEQIPTLYIIDIDIDGNAVLRESVEADTGRIGERMDGVVVAPDGNTAYLMFRSGIIFKIDLVTLETQRLPHAVVGGSFNSIAVHPKGDYLYAYTSSTTELEVYDLNNGYEKVAKFRATSTPIFNAAGSLMTLPYFSANRYIEPNEHSVTAYLSELEDWVSLIGFAQNDEILITKTLGNQIAIYGTRSANRLKRFELKRNGAFANLDRAFVSRCGGKIYGTDRGEVAVYEISKVVHDDLEDMSLEKLKKIRTLETGTHQPYDVIRDPSENRLLVFDRDYHEFDGQGKIISIEIPSGQISVISDSDFSGAENNVGDRKIDPSGEYLFLVSPDWIKRVHLETLEVETFGMAVDVYSIGQAAFKDDETLLITATKREITDRGTRIDTGLLMAYNLTDETIDWKVELSLNHPQDIAITPDQSIAVIGSPIGQSTVIVDIDQGEVIEEAGVGRVNSISVSEDGSTAYLLSQYLFVLNLNDFSYDRFFAGTGEKRYHNVLEDKNLILVSNEGDNNIALLDKKGYSAFGTAHVGVEPFGVFYFSDSDTLVTFDDSSNKLVLFEMP